MTLHSTYLVYHDPCTGNNSLYRLADDGHASNTPEFVALCLATRMSYTCQYLNDTSRVLHLVWTSYQYRLHEQALDVHDYTSPHAQCNTTG